MKWWTILALHRDVSGVGPAHVHFSHTRPRLQTIPSPQSIVVDRHGSLQKQCLDETITLPHPGSCRTKLASASPSFRSLLAAPTGRDVDGIQIGLICTLSFNKLMRKYGHTGENVTLKWREIKENTKAFRSCTR